MKIVHVVHSFLPAQGGIEHHVYNLSKELIKKGNKVTVITTKEKNSKNLEYWDNIKIIRCDSIQIPFFSSVKISIGVFFELLKEDADIYASHGYGSIMPLCAAAISFIKRKPFIFTLHGYPELTGFKKLFYFLYKYLVASIFLKFAKRVIIVSQKSKEKIKYEYDEKKIIYIPNGISKNFNCKTSFIGKNKITYIGRLDEDKQIDHLIEAFSKLKNRKKYELWIVGKDEGIKNNLIDLANRLKIKYKFIYLPYNKIKKIYENSKLIVLPSKYEGFSLVWLETVACGRPIFSRKVGDAEYFFAEVYEKPELFLFDTKEELVKKLNYFLENEKNYKKMINKAKKILKLKYSWENVAIKTLNLYKEITNTK
jgi:glycosyltransferase involved in cell wall biosynthesis